MLRFIFLFIISFQNELPLHYYEVRGEYDSALVEAINLYKETGDSYYLKKVVSFAWKLQKKFWVQKYSRLYLKKFGFDEEVVRYYIRSLIDEGKEKIASEILDNLALQYGVEENAPVFGRLFFECGELKKAEEYLERAVRDFPDSTGLQKLYVRVLKSQGKYEEALKYLESLGSDDETLLEEKAEILAVLGEKDEAIKLYEEFLKRGMGDYRVYVNLVRLYLDTDMVENAFKILSVLRRIYPYDYRIQNLYAYTLYRAGRYNEAFEAYLKLSALFEDNPEVHYYLSRTLYAMGLVNDALKEIERAIKMEKKYDYLIYRVFLLIEGKRYDDARLELLKLKTEGKDDPYYNYLCAYVHDALGYKDLAYKYYRNALLRDSTNIKRYFDMIDFLVEQGRKKEADSLLLKTLGLARSKDELLRIALYSHDIGNFSLAESLYCELIKMDSLNPVYYNNLGYLLVEEGVELERAKTLLKKALELDPQNPLYLDSMGWLYFKLGLYRKSADFIEKAIELDGKKSPEILRHGIEVEKKLGNYDKALQYEKMLRECEND